MSVSSPQNPEWQILTCPSCAGLFKVPRGRSGQGDQVKCPRCNAVTPVPAPADEETQRISLSSPPPEGKSGPAAGRTGASSSSEKPDTATGGEAALETGSSASGSGAGGRSIPQVRGFDPEAPLVRGRGREGWEPQTPELRKVDFKDKLAKTTDAARQPDPDQPAMVRRDWRREKAVAEMTGWETGAAAESAPIPRNRQWLLIAGLGLCVVGLLAVVIKLLVMDNKIQDPGAAGGGAVAGLTDQATLETAPVADYRDEVWKVVQRFTRAATPDEMVPLIRERERVEPLLRAHYARGAPFAPFDPQRPPDLMDLQAVQDFVVFMLEMPDFTHRAIAVEKTPEGFRVDWESFTGYSEMTWKELQEERPRKPVLIRAIMQPDSYPNFDFTNPATHRCYRLTTPNGEESLYGYVEAGGKAEENIQKAILRAPSMHAVLRVQYPEKSTSPKQVLITELMIKGWILKKNGEASEDPAAGLLGGK